MLRQLFRRRPIAILAATAALAAAAALLVCGTVPPSAPASAPAVVFTTLKGEKLPLQSLQGKVVLVNFWAPSCAPCVREMPMLADTYGKLHARGLEVVAVAASYDPPNVIFDYAQTRRLPFAVALDIDDAIANAFGGLRAVPSTFIVGRDGRIAQRFDGALDPARLQQALERQLGPG